MADVLCKVNTGSLMFDCPGCGIGHVIHPEGCESNNPARWQWNGSLDRPTFSPSLLVSWESRTRGKQVCHSFIVDGKMQFLGDCTHDKANQTVDIPVWED